MSLDGLNQDTHTHEIALVSQMSENQRLDIIWPKVESLLDDESLNAGNRIERLKMYLETRLRTLPAETRELLENSDFQKNAQRFAVVAATLGLVIPGAEHWSIPEMTALMFLLVDVLKRPGRKSGE